jgi:hypothetical protein
MLGPDLMVGASLCRLGLGRLLRRLWLRFRDSLSVGELGLGLGNSFGFGFGFGVRVLVLVLVLRLGDSLRLCGSGGRGVGPCLVVFGYGRGRRFGYGIGGHHGRTTTRSDSIVTVGTMLEHHGKLFAGPG